LIRLRLAFYVLYVVLGATIAARLLPLGLRVETVAGFVLAAALIVLGLYRIRLWFMYR
jgi:hypothetical protein